MTAPLDCPNRPSLSPWQLLTVLGLFLLTQATWARAAIPGDWDDRFFLSPGCDGNILASATAPDGRVFLGGQFSYCNGVLANNLVIYNPLTQRYVAVLDDGVSGVSGVVTAMAVDGENLYVAGDFDQAGPLSVRNIARLNSSGWARLGTEQDNGVEGEIDGLPIASVSDLALVGGRLYVAGFFDTAGAIQANNIAYWESDQWFSLGSEAENGVNSTVKDILALGSQLVLGGSFTQAGSIEANRVALWTGSAWASIGTGSNNGVGLGSSQTVNALASLGTDLVVGGRFERSIDGSPRYNLVRWDGSAWQAFGAEDTRFSTDRINALLVRNGDLYAGGSFTEMDAVPVNHLARWDGSQWHPVGALEASGVSGSSFGSGLRSGSVSHLRSVAGGMLVGGGFSSADGIKAMGVALFLDNNTIPLGLDEGLGLNGSVEAIVVFQNQIYVGGQFEYAGPERVNHIARFDGVQWQPLEQDGFIGISNSSTSNYRVEALAVFDGELYVGGNFSNLADLGSEASRLVRWSGTAWQPLTVRPATGEVQALSVHEGRLYVGGSFLSLSDGRTANRVFSFDGENASPLENFIGNGVDDWVLSLASSTDGLYVGGWFDTAAGTPAENLALWDGSGFSSPGGGPGGDVEGISAHQDRLFVCGSFFSPEQGETSRVLSTFTGGSWTDPAGFEDGFCSHLLDDPIGLIIAGRVETGDGRVLGISVLDEQGQVITLGDLPPSLAFSGSGGSLAVRRLGESLLVGGGYRWLGGLPVAGFSIFRFETTVEDAIFADRFEDPLR
jgi:hypothetical protein